VDSREHITATHGTPRHVCVVCGMRTCTKNAGISGTSRTSSNGGLLITWRALATFCSQKDVPCKHVSTLTKHINILRMGGNARDISEQLSIPHMQDRQIRIWLILNRTNLGLNHGLLSVVIAYFNSCSQ
jgi:hypothetical protein